jgi:hypothetical protein
VNISSFSMISSLITMMSEHASLEIAVIVSTASMSVL